MISKKNNGHGASRSSSLDDSSSKKSAGFFLSEEKAESRGSSCNGGQTLSEHITMENAPCLIMARNSSEKRGGHQAAGARKPWGNSSGFWAFSAERVSSLQRLAGKKRYIRSLFPWHREETTEYLKKRIHQDEHTMESGEMWCLSCSGSSERLAGCTRPYVDDTRFIESADDAAVVLVTVRVEEG